MPSLLVRERLAWAAALILTTGVLTSASWLRGGPQQQTALSAGPATASPTRPRSHDVEANAAALDNEHSLADLFLQRRRDSQHLDDAVAAYEEAQRAIAANPRLLEARISLALALEAISTSFRRDATKAWEEYLALDAISTRAKDITRHLEAYTKEPTSGALLFSTPKQ